MTEDERLEDKIARVEGIVKVEERFSAMAEELRIKDAEIKRLQSENRGIKRKEYVVNVGRKLSSFGQAVAPFVFVLGIGVGVIYGGYKSISLISDKLNNSNLEMVQEQKKQEDKITQMKKVSQEEYDHALNKVMSTDFETIKKLCYSFSKALENGDRELLKEFFHCHYSIVNNSEYNLMETVVAKKFKEEKYLIQIFGINYALYGNKDSPERNYSVLLKVTMGSAKGEQIDVEGSSKILCNNQQCYFILEKIQRENCPDYVGVIK